MNLLSFRTICSLSDWATSSTTSLVTMSFRTLSVQSVTYRVKLRWHSPPQLPGHEGTVLYHHEFA